MRGPVGGEPDKKAQADENTEREAWGITAPDWNAAFGWASAEPDNAAGTDGGAFRVWRCNWDAVACFMACQTQWRVAPMGGVLGFEYPGIEVVMRRKKVKDRAAMFEKLQLMEAAALAVLRG